MRADVNLSVREVEVKHWYENRDEELELFQSDCPCDRQRARPQIELLEEGRRSSRRRDAGMTTRNTPMRCVLKRMRKITVISRIRIFRRSASAMNGWNPSAPPAGIAAEKMARYQSEYGLSEYDSRILTESKKMADMFEKTTTICQKPKKAANWLIGEASRLLKEKGQDAESLWFSRCIWHSSSIWSMPERSITTRQRSIYSCFRARCRSSAYVDAHGLGMVNDDSALEQAVSDVLAANRRRWKSIRVERQSTWISGWSGDESDEGKANPVK